MGFFSKLKKVVAGIDKAAAIGAVVLPGKAGKMAGTVGEASGVVTEVVKQIQARFPPNEAGVNAALATAVAVDDHEERMKRLEELVLAMSGKK